MTVRGRLNELVFGVPDEPAAEGTDGEIAARDVLAWVKTDPGRLSLNTMLIEIGKLEAIRAVGLPVADAHGVELPSSSLESFQAVPPTRLWRL